MRPTFIHLIMMAVLYVASLGGYQIWYSKVTGESAAVTSLQNTIDTREESLHRTSSDRAVLTQLVDDEIAVQNYFVPESRAASFINDLEGRGRSLGSVVTVSSVAKSGADVQAQLTLALSIQGTFDSVMRTVGAIEHAPYDLSVATLVLVKEVKDTWKADLRVTVGAAPPITKTP